MYQGEIPFTRYGDQINYIGYGSTYYDRAAGKHVDAIWKPNTPFVAVMKLTSYSRGRSAANFEVEDESGNRYTMFLTDFVDLVKHCKLEYGKTQRLKWAFCKRGSNYGLQCLELQ